MPMGCFEFFFMVLRGHGPARGGERDGSPVNECMNGRMDGRMHE